MRHFPGQTICQAANLSQQILKDTYHTKNQNEIKVSENWGKKSQWIKEIKREMRKYLREKGKQKYNISKLKGCSKSGAKGEIYRYKHTKIRKLKSHKL